MNPCPFELVHPYPREPLADPSLLSGRPCLTRKRSHAEESEYFVPGAELATAINTALCLGDPLLVTGEPGTGKTQSAYFVARALNLGPVLHFQVRSTSVARDLLYSFDTVAYFQQANLRESKFRNPDGTLDKKRFRRKGVLWEAIESAREKKHPRVLLIDEIDKAPRDFPNDLLHELDQMEIACPETEESLRAEPGERPVTIITSNSERRLPEPFLRRCVYHHIEFTRELLKDVLVSRRKEFEVLSPAIQDLAIDRFMLLRERGLRKIPSTAEFLVWLRVLASTANLSESRLREVNLSRLPGLGALVKNHEDLKDMKVTGPGR